VNISCQLSVFDYCKFNFLFIAIIFWLLELHKEKLTIFEGNLVKIFIVLVET